VVGGAFISLKKGSVDNVLVRDGSNLPFISKRRKKGVLNEKEWDDLMETVKRTVREYTDNIRESKFPLKPKKCPKISNYGSFCDFVNICPWEGEDQ
jgi:ATP-dependent helicase/DNAse subunit B